jgi:hypothetical protein
MYLMVITFPRLSAKHLIYSHTRYYCPPFVLFWMLSVWQVQVEKLHASEGIVWLTIAAGFVESLVNSNLVRIVRLAPKATSATLQLSSASTSLILVHSLWTIFKLAALWVPIIRVKFFGWKNVFILSLTLKMVAFYWSLTLQSFAGFAYYSYPNSTPSGHI